MSALNIVRFEVTTTRDERVDQPDGSWSLLRVSPPGDGWRGIDTFSDRFSRWIRHVRSGEPAS